MTAPPNPASDNGSATRERILLAAAALFADRGFDAPSVREICEAAGVSKPMLYYHFESRVGVVRAVVEYLHAGFETLISELFDPEGASVEGLIAGYTALFDRIDERGWMVRLWSRIPTMDPELLCVSIEERRGEAAVAAYIAALPGLPGHTDIEAATWLLLASFGPIAMHKQLAPLPVSNQTLAERLVRQALGCPLSPSDPRAPSEPRRPAPLGQEAS